MSTLLAAPRSERERLALIERLRILDSAQERRFNDLARLAAHICEAPIALVSVVDANRQWFKSRIGLDVEETPRAVSFCAHAIQRDEVMVVGDATKDPRFATSPLVVGAPFIRFYAGAPLLAQEGHGLGTLCVIDHQPRPGLRPEQEEMLRLLALQVVDQLETSSRIVDLEKAALVREQAMLAHAHAEARLTAICTSTPIGTLVISTTGRIELANPSIGTLLGYRPEELTGAPLSMITSPDDEALNEDLRRRWLSGHLSLYRAERRVRRRDGSELWVQVNAAPLHEGDSVTGIAIQVEDLTERRATQNRLMIADRMAAVGTLSAGVAHEINNPLTYVMANLDIVAEEIRVMSGGSPSGRMREMADMIAEAREGAERVRRIVRGLRTLARGEGDERVVLDVRNLLDLAANMSGHEVRRRARLVKLYGDIPLVLADETRLGQVFVNLLVNAAQALPDGDPEHNEVRIATSTAEDGSAVVEVSDTGSGIAPEILTRIFDPFFTTKPAGVGTGLGLSICHGIVEALGGRLTAANGSHRGAVFRVVLQAAPTLTGLDSGPAQRSVTESVTRRGRVLLIEDDPAVASTVKRALRHQEVVWAKDGKAGLRAAERDGQFDLILCDLMMPEMTGEQVYGHLLSSRPSLLKKMVFLTGGGTTPEARTFLDQLPLECVEKPFAVSDLRALVDRFVGGG